jgi:hypothetical protein
MHEVDQSAVSKLTVRFQREGYGFKKYALFAVVKR